MNVVSLGKIPVPTPGTPVSLDGTGLIKAHSITFSQIPGTTGRVVLGLVGLNKATYAKAIRPFLAPGASGFIDQFDLEGRDDDGMTLNLGDFVIDADVANEGLVVSYKVI